MHGVSTNLATRIAAFVGGIIVLALGSVISVGAALLAPIAIFVASRIVKARGGALTLWSSWVVAACSVGIGILLGGAVVALKLPNGSLQQVRTSYDSSSAQAAKQPPPKWLERIAPGSAARASQAQPRSHAMQTGLLAVGGMMMFSMLGGIVGSLGWAAALLLAFGAQGRWIGAGTGASPEIASAELDLD
ncbi:MAG: hypothetical protein JWO05_2526 [Gemmatimonadetes bacterium]|nr:hypothetical protein [Gemmatimonadota bacterium]